MANVFIKLLLSINLTKITTQATKLRPLICVTGWLLPPRHEFPHCQIHIMSTHVLTSLIIYPRPILTSHIVDPRPIHMNMPMVLTEALL